MSNEMEREILRVLNQDQRDLLSIAAADLLPKMHNEDDNVESLSQGAFHFYDKVNRQMYQVQVKVTRNPECFIEGLETNAIVNENFKPEILNKNSKKNHKC
jgi:hypothetical protein